MQIKTMLEEMASDLKALRFAFPVECRTETHNGDMLKASFRMSKLHLAEISVRQCNKSEGTRLYVHVNTCAQCMTVSEARIQHHVLNEVLALAGFFETTLHNRIFED
jgi:hypothetical protein